MMFFAPITVEDGADLDAAAAALVEKFDDGVSQEAVRKILEAGQVVMPAQMVFEVAETLSPLDIEVGGPLNTTVAIPGSELEQAVPASYRSSSIISRLLGEEQGEIPTSAVYDLIDLLTAIEVPDSEEETALIGEVLARAVLGVTGEIPEKIQMAAGLLHYRNAYQERLSTMIDPDAEAAPEGPVE
jgi:hypothetical protein